MELDALNLLKINNVLSLYKLKYDIVEKCRSLEGSCFDIERNQAINDCIDMIYKIDLTGFEESYLPREVDDLRHLCRIFISKDENKLTDKKLSLLYYAITKSFEQALTDPENQPSQFGTVPLEWYENLENKIDKIRYNVGEVIDSLYGSYEAHGIRKKLQEAINHDS
jgi:hypothetical protein